MSQKNEKKVKDGGQKKTKITTGVYVVAREAFTAPKAPPNLFDRTYVGPDRWDIPIHAKGYVMRHRAIDRRDCVDVEFDVGGQRRRVEVAHDYIKLLVE